MLDSNGLSTRLNKNNKVATTAMLKKTNKFNKRQNKIKLNRKIT